MIKVLNMKIGEYILYEHCGPVQFFDRVFDPHVKIVTEYGQIKDNGLGIQQAIFEKLQVNNTKLFIYFDGDIPLGMMWGHRGGCYIRGPGIPLFFDEKTVYWFWIYTLPEARGKNIYKKLRNAFFAYYHDCKCFAALVDPCNTYMKSEISKIGFVEAKSYFYIKCKNLSIVLERCNSSRKYIMSIENGNKHNLDQI